MDIDHQEDNVRKYYFANIIKLVLLCVNDEYVCACVYVCVYHNIYVCICNIHNIAVDYMYTHSYIHTYTYIHMYTHTYTHTYTHIYTHIHLDEHEFKHFNGIRGWGLNKG